MDRCDPRSRPLATNRAAHRAEKISAAYRNPRHRRQGIPGLRCRATPNTANLLSENRPGVTAAGVSLRRLTSRNSLTLKNFFQHGVEDGSRLWKSSSLYSCRIVARIRRRLWLGAQPEPAARRRRSAIEYRTNPAARNPKEPTRTWTKKLCLSAASAGGISARMIETVVVRNPRPFQNRLPAFPPGTGIAPGWRAISRRSLMAAANI